MTKRPPRIVMEPPAGAKPDWMPRRSAVAWYWLRTPAGRERASFWAELDWLQPVCFACGNYNPFSDKGQPWEDERTDDQFFAIWDHATELQRCHLLAKALGGPATASNLVLLCVECHTAAPDVPDPDVMLRWVARRPKTSPLHKLDQQAPELIAELEGLGVDPHAVAVAFRQPDWRERLEQTMAETIIHFGDTGPTTSQATRAWIIAKAFGLLP